jgi:hypothetical protein
MDRDVNSAVHLLRLGGVSRKIRKMKVDNHLISTPAMIIPLSSHWYHDTTCQDHDKRLLPPPNPSNRSLTFKRILTPEPLNGPPKPRVSQQRFFAMPRTWKTPFFKGAISMTSLSSLHRKFSSSKRSNTVPGATPPSTLLEGGSSEWDRASETQTTNSNDQSRKRWSWMLNGHEDLLPQPLIIEKTNNMNPSIVSNSNQDPKAKT